MLQSRIQTPDGASTGSRARAASPAPEPFFGGLRAVLVEDGGDLSFEGAIRRSEAAAVWTWLSRDVAPDLIDPNAPADDPRTLPALEALTSVLLSRARAHIAAATSDPEADRRLRTQLGGAEMRRRLPTVLHALKCLPLYDKARAFGRTVNSLPDNAALLAALQAMPWHDGATASLLMVAALGEVAVPERLIICATRIAGEATEAALQRARLGPLVEGTLARAQDTLLPLRQVGAFADVDLVCQALERFHRLTRAVSTSVELARGSRWSTAIGSLTRTVSQRIEPRLRQVVPDINRAMRQMREGPDRLDNDALLSALGGVYVLATVRDCRDSLALNEVFDETWTRSGQTLELCLDRTLDALRDDPGNGVLASRLDTGIKMAELRFGAAYADVLRRAKDGIEKRLSSA
jgi:hypothetical protein